MPFIATTWSLPADSRRSAGRQRSVRRAGSRRGANPPADLHAPDALRVGRSQAEVDVRREEPVRRLVTSPVHVRRADPPCLRPERCVDRRSRRDAPRTRRCCAVWTCPDETEAAFLGYRVQLGYPPTDPKGLALLLHARWVSEALYRMWLDGVSLVTCWLIPDESSPQGMFQSGLYLPRPKGVASDKPKPLAARFPVPVRRLPSERTARSRSGSNPDEHEQVR